MRRWRRRDWFRVQVVAAFAICSAAIAFAAPNLARGSTAWPSWLPSQQIPLGVDLVGGTTLLVEPEWRSVYADVLRELRLQVRNTLRDARIRYDNLRVVAGRIRFELVDSADAERASNVLAASAADWRPPPLSSLPSIATRVRGSDVTVAITHAGRQAIHDASLDTATVRLHRQMRCRGADYKLTREGDRLRLVIRRDELPDNPGHQCFEA